MEFCTHLSRLGKDILKIMFIYFYPYVSNEKPKKGHETIIRHYPGNYPDINRLKMFRTFSYKKSMRGITLFFIII